MRKLIDLTGKRFGRLEVLYRDPDKTEARPRWICRCDCGEVVSIEGVSLRRGFTKSCGCLRKEKGNEIGRRSFIDMTGKRFGRLIVLRRDTYPSEEAYWVCQCDCGNVVSVRGSNLRQGVTRSCGCLRVEHAAEMRRRKRKC